MSAPYEIIAGPVDLYLAPVGTAFPAINVAPAAAWVKLGAQGSKNYSEDGVLVRAEQNIDVVRTLGATGPRKAFRGTEGLIIEVTVLDATIETYQAALNQSAITTVVGPPAEKTIPLLQGSAVALRALICRGLVSPYADSVVNSQWDVPIVFQNANPETVYKKNVPVGLKFSFMALQDDTAGFGKLRSPTA